MADAAVLAHHVLVEEHDPRARPVVGRGIGAADQVDDLVRLDAARARIHRVGPDARDVVDLEGGDRAVPHDRRPALHRMVAGVDVADEALEPVGHELDRAAEHLRQRGGGHLVGVDVHLDAEGAADVLAHDAHLALPQGEVLGDDVLDHVRGLGGLVERQVLLGRVPVRHDGARLERHAGVPAELEGRLDDLVGVREGAVDLAGVEVALEGEVVAELGMDRRRAGRERRLDVDDRLELLPVDRHELGRVLGLGPAARDDGRHGLALPAGTVDRERVLRRRLEALEVRQHADPRRHDLRHLRARDDGDHAGGGLRLGRVDPEDLRVRIGRAHEGDMHHARQADVADILPAAAGQAPEVRARHGAADIGVRAVEDAQALAIRSVVHWPSPALACAALSIASTIAW